MKKIISLSIALILIISLFACFPVSAANVINDTLLNGDFADTSFSYDYKGRPVPSGWQHQEGNNGISFGLYSDVDGANLNVTSLICDFDSNLEGTTDYRIDYNWFMYYQYVKVVPNTDYTLNGWYAKNVSATNANTIQFVSVSDYATGTDLLKCENTDKRGGWIRYEQKFNTGSANVIKISLATYNNEGGIEGMQSAFAYMHLYQGETVVEKENLVVNGSMESWIDESYPTFTRLTDWNYDSNNADFNVSQSFYKEEGVSGYSYHGTTRKSWLGEISSAEIELKEDTDYTFSYYKKANKTDVIIVGKIVRADTNSVIATAETTLNAADTWQEVSINFNSGNNTKVKVLLQYYNKNASNDNAKEYDFWFDEVCVAEYVAPIVTNGSMELWNDVGTAYERLDSWTYDGSNFDGIVKPYTKVTGVKGYALQATNTLSWLGQYYQDLILEPNKDYKFSFYDKSNHTDVVMMGYIVPTEEGNDSSNILIKLEKGVSSVDTWQKLEGVFNSGKVTNARIVLRYYQKDQELNTDYTFSFDEVAIEENNHTHTYTFTLVNENNHLKKCIDGDLELQENHTFTKYYNTATVESKGTINHLCTDCGYYKSEVSFALADVNGDQKINIIDLVRIKKQLADATIVLVDYTGDLNKDKAIDSLDVAMLRKTLLK